MSFDPEQSEPAKLADAFRAAYTHRPTIPASVEASILAAARDKFDRRRRTRLIARWGTGLAAGLAAAIALAVVLYRPSSPGQPAAISSATVPASPLAKGDIDANRRLDMVDALTLARHLAARDPLDPRWDITGDGAIDQRDVDAIASASVNLKQTGLAQRSLPKLKELGLDRLPVGSASADVRTFAHAASAKSTNPEAHP